MGGEGGMPGKKSSKSSGSLNNLRAALKEKNGSGSNLSAISLTNFLKTTLDIAREEETRRIVDIMTNKNSLYGSKGGTSRQPTNPYARNVTVDEAQAVVTCLAEFGFEKSEVKQLVISYPQILCYSVEDRIMIMLNYLVDNVGIERHDVRAMLLSRPTLLGLPSQQVEQLLSFLIENGTSQDDIINLLEKSL
jgi:hypothetical protein